MTAIRDGAYRLDEAYTRETGAVYLTGTQALIRLLLTQRRVDRAAGLTTNGFVSGYRGSPLAGLDRAMGGARGFLEAHGVHFRPGLNEALAASAVMGSQQVEAFGKAKVDGVYGLWYGKGPGVDWAGDAIRHGHAYGTSKHGGVLLVAGDDHGAVSSTMAHNSDETLVAWHIPVLNPANIADYLDLGLYGYALSRFSGGWAGFKAISEVVEGAARVVLPNGLPCFVEPAGAPDAPGGVHFRFLDPPSVAIEERLLIKAERARIFGAANRVDRTIADPVKARLGVVTVGKAHGDLMEALRRLGFADARAIAALGVRLIRVRQSWPLDREGMRAFARGLGTILVVEEKRPLVEGQLRDLLYGTTDAPLILGKTDARGQSLLPTHGELRPHRLLDVLAPLLERAAPGLDLVDRLRGLKTPPVLTVDQARTPYFCAGCPHSSSTKLPDGSHAFGGIGCHIMAAWMDRGTIGTTHMGGEGSNWLGLAPFTEHRHVFQNLGDGTYFHSGSLAVRAAVAAKARITFKVLFNDAVAMTGGQAHDGPLDVPRITRQMRAEGVERIAIVGDDIANYEGVPDLAPGTTLHDRADLLDVETSLRDFDGVSVLVFDQTCAAEKRRRRKRGTVPDPNRRLVINEAVCEACGDCSVKSNCVAIVPKVTEFGVKRGVDPSACNKDETCLEGFCPSFVAVEGATPRARGRLALSDLEARLERHGGPHLPGPAPTFEALVAGIGGTGVLTVGAVLGMAAHLEGLAVSVLDFTGLAQKNGAVLSHVRVAAEPNLLHQGRIEPGAADLVLAADALVAASNDALAAMRPGRTWVVANAEVKATSAFVRDRDAVPDTDRTLALIAGRVGAERLEKLDAAALAAAAFGDAVYANVLLLGYAWQRGRLPVSREAVETAIGLNGAAVETNLAAFAAGRLLAAEPDFAAELLPKKVEPATDLGEVVERRRAYLKAYQDEAYAADYVAAVDRVRRREAEVMGWGETRLALAAARNLFKLMAVKDEYEVARLFTDGAFRHQLDRAYEPGYKIRFYMAPPGSGAKKRAFGPWLWPALRLLAKGRRLRGTRLDPFGWQGERQEERRLRHDYLALIEGVLAHLTPERHGAAVGLLAAVDAVRGFGHVKAAAIQAYDARLESLWQNFVQEPTPAPAEPTAPLVAAE